MTNDEKQELLQLIRQAMKEEIPPLVREIVRDELTNHHRQSSGTNTIWLQTRNLLVKRRRYFLVPLVWLIILIIGITAIELYARHLGGYNLWSWALTKGAVATTKPANPNFFNLDYLKVWNRKFYESRRQYFVNWPIPLKFFETPDSTPRYLFKPNLQMTYRNGQFVPAQPDEKIWWSSNSWGFRGAEFSVEKPPGTIRIVTLGASTTEGSQSNEETYPYYLELELNRRFPDQAIEVINAGHHGQDIHDLAAIGKQRVLPLKPDVVIFYEANNDLFPGEWTYDTWNLGCCYDKDPAWYQLLRQYSALFLVISDGWKREFGEIIPPPQPHSFDPLLPHPTFEKWVKALRRIVHGGKANNVIVALSSFVTVAHKDIVFSPKEKPHLYGQLYQKYYPFTPAEIAMIFDYYNTASARVAQEENVPYCDIAGQYPRDLHYFWDHIHFKPEGNQLLAKFFADCLAEKVLPGLLANKASVTTEKQTEPIGAIK